MASDKNEAPMSTIVQDATQEEYSEQAMPIGSFIDYKRVVLTVTGDLNRLRGFAETLELQEAARLIDEVRERVENDSFKVAVVGEFKRGKSTFINALLGVSVLPTDVLPCSATLNRVTYGLTPRVVLRFKDGRQEDVQFDRLDVYVTQLTNESLAVAKTIEEAIVYYPSHYCQNNVDVIDTPGLNDDSAMTDVTLSILPRIDVAIMVILAQSPFGEYERDFLENRLLTADLGRVCFVVNGVDNFNCPEDADRVVHGIQERIQKNVIERAKRQFGADSSEFETYVKKIGKPRVFGLSAYQAIKAKQTNDMELLERSRFPVFERELQRLLTERRGAVTLQVPVNRIIATCHDILETVSLRRNALHLKRDEFEQAYKMSNIEIESLKQRKSKELETVCAAGEATFADLTPLADALPEALKSAVNTALDKVAIERSELDDTDRLKERLGKLVDNEIRSTSDSHANSIQSRINNALAAEVERLSDFACTASALMERININFGGVEAEYRFRGKGEAWAAAIAVITGFGGVWSGYRQAGSKGAAIGAVASVGTAMAAGVVLAALAMPLSLPVILGVGLASIFPGTLAAKLAFPKERVERFRESYKESVLKQLDQALKQADFKYQVHEQVRLVFNILRDNISKEVDAALADAEMTLITLRARYERETVVTDSERQTLDEIESATHKIAEAANRLSKQLVEIMEI